MRGAERPLIRRDAPAGRWRLTPHANAHLRGPVRCYRADHNRARLVPVGQHGGMPAVADDGPPLFRSWIISKAIKGGSVRYLRDSQSDSKSCPLPAEDWLRPDARCDAKPLFTDPLR